METFLFDKKASILLYGAAAIGNIMYENLVRQNFNVIGFIDKRAYELSEFRNLPVWHMNDERLSKARRSTVIVIVSVKNVFEHEQIVTELLKYGYCNIVYKSRTVLNNKALEDKLKLSDLYDAILSNACLSETVLVKTVSTQICEYKDYALIKEENDMVICQIPLEYIYTNAYTPGESKWGNVNIMAFFTHIRFFRLLLGDTTQSYQYYLEEYCIYTAPPSVKITDGWKKNVLRNRSMIFEQMNLSCELDADFFIRNPAEAIWNEKGYFNLTSGKHRASFFAAKGYKFLPVKISRKDYESFLNLKHVDAIREYMEKEHISELALPVPHPYFYHYPSLANEFYYKMLSYYSDFIAVREYFPARIPDYSHVTTVEYGADAWGIAAHLSRMGCQSYRISTEDTQTLYRILKQALHVPALREIHLEEIQHFKIDYFFLETDDENLIQSILNQTLPGYLIIICDYQKIFNLYGYQVVDKGICTYKNNRMIHTLCYQKD